MALCLARSMAECRTYDKRDVACSYTYWMRSGPVYAGVTTRAALDYSKMQRSILFTFF